MEDLRAPVTDKVLPLGGRVLAARMRTPDIVTFEGSVYGGWNLLSKQLGEVPILAGALFDTGTKSRSKATLRDAIANRGASLSFSGGGDRTYFNGSCLPEDLPFLLSLTAECLESSTFANTELGPARTRILTKLKDQSTYTRTQAANALARLMYAPDHVNYVDTDADRKRFIEKAARHDLLSFQKMVGRGGLVVALAGDLEPQEAIAVVERAFARNREGTLTVPPKKRNTKAPTSQEKRIAIPGKANIDVYLGTSVPVIYGDEQYYPLTVLTSMLGGGFAAHLMQTVRERDGLTYGIRASLGGMDIDTDGYFRIWSTFAPGLLEKGVETIRKETGHFMADCLTEENLRKAQDEITGSYLLDLSTTGGLAGMLHMLGRRRKPLSWLSEFPEVIRTITVDDLHTAAALIPLDKLSLAAAGTFDLPGKRR